jgi:Lon protease-like protein
MVRHCLQYNRPFGVALIRQGDEALGPLARPYDVGCTANIMDVEQLANGRMNITVIGEDRFRILETSSAELYLSARVELLPLDQPYNLPLVRGVKRLAPWVHHYLKALSALGSEYELELSHLEMPEDPLLLLYMAAAMLQVPLAEKQALLAEAGSRELLVSVMRLYRRELSLLGALKDISEPSAQRLAWLN